MPLAAAVHESFGNLMDASHTGRIGDSLTLTGRLVDEVALELRGHSIYFPKPISRNKYCVPIIP